MNTSRARLIALSATALLLQACATQTHFESATLGATLSLQNKAAVALPANLSVDSKSSGQHPYMVVNASGDKLYGILPLHVNGATMATSILFFAPALVLGGFRDSYPFYQFDVEAGVLRYRMKETDEWRFSKPTSAEADRAKAVFERASVAQGKATASKAKQGDQADTAEAKAD